MSRPRAWVGFVLIFVTCLVFGRVWVFDFTIWDDNIVVWNNPYLNPPSLANTWHFWTHPYYTLYLPVTYSLWSIVAAAGWSNQPDGWGNHLNPYLFHGLNLVLHAACVLSVWRLVRRLVHNDLAAAIGALIFAVHPVQVEAVAWVTGTRDLLGMLFGTLAILAYLDFRDAPTTDQRWLNGLLATLLYVAALFSKPTAVVTPILAALISAWEPRRWQRREWALLATWLVGAAIDALATRAKQPVDPMILRGQPGLWFRPIVALDALAFDVGKLLWPVNLGIDYGRTPLRLLQTGQWMWTWIIPVTIAATLLKSGRRAWLCAGVFVVALLPLLGFTPFRFQVYYGTVADRYLYPAMIGVSLGAALAWSKLNVKQQRPAIIIATIALTLCGVISFHQLSFWPDSMALFTRTIEVNPRTFSGHHNRGAVENHDEQFQAAEADFRTLIEIAPDAPEGYRGLARAHLGMGQVDDALADWTKALAVEERNIDKHGDMTDEYRQKLAHSYLEAAAVARSVNRRDLWQLWSANAQTRY